MFELLAGIDKYIKSGEIVVLKPNSCTYFGSVMEDRKTGEEIVNLQGAANTDARVLAALTKLTLEKGNAKEVITAETCAFDFHEPWQACITLDVSGIKTAEPYKDITSNTHFYPGCCPMDANITLPGTIINKYKSLRG